MSINSKWEQFRITRITDLDGNDRGDARYAKNIGRLCLPNGSGEGSPCFIVYTTPKDGDRLFIGTVTHIERTKTTLVITTDHSVWHFKRILSSVKREAIDAEKE